MSTRNALTATLLLFVVPPVAVAWSPPQLAAAVPVTTVAKGKALNGGMYDFDVSPNGRFVVYTSNTANIVPGLIPSAIQVFWLDRITKKTRWVSVGTDGSQANDHCYGARISDNGKRVVFVTRATNFGASSPNSKQVVLADLSTDEASVVSVTNSGSPANADCIDAAISGDGRVVAFSSSATNLAPMQPQRHRAYVHDLNLQETECVSVSSAEVYADDSSSAPVLSRDGRHVAFQSLAGNLPLPGSPKRWKILVRDRALGSTSLVSQSTSGSVANDASLYPGISADGRYIAFESSATDLTAETDSANTADLFVFDREKGAMLRFALGLDPAIQEHVTSLSMSDDGRRVALGCSYVNASDSTIPADRIRVVDAKSKQMSKLQLTLDFEANQEDSVHSPLLSGNGKRLWFESISPLIDANPKGHDWGFELKISKLK